MPELMDSKLRVSDAYISRNPGTVLSIYEDQEHVYQVWSPAQPGIC